TAYFQFSPELKIILKDGWYFDLYPSSDIRINFGDPVSGQKGRLFLPFDFALGRNITKKVLVGLEISLPMIDEYPLYRYKTEARLTVTF
ncbi:MAG TPA: hypothetical protein VHY34_04140, partial [Caulobacteraceae bacterium]|nr:hypothetical protein [Caulobacteraceae bacterium]